MTARQFYKDTTLKLRLFHCLVEQTLTIRLPRAAAAVVACCALGAMHAAAASPTTIALDHGRWRLNGAVTYPGTKAEGLLMNVRMVNATFEDANDATRPKGFDADANTDRFIARIPDYAAHGVRAFTLGLQGGHCGYEGAVNSAFAPDGSLRGGYMRRVERVLRACDERGLVVILGCYYQRQSAILRDEAALRAGVVNVVNWLRASGLRNVALEVANEYTHKGFAHPLIRSPEGMAGLIRLAKQTWPELLVSASGYGSGRLDAAVAEASDFLLPHFNGTKLADIPARLAALKQFGKPVVVNEDDKVGADGAQAAKLCVEAGASWGFMHSAVNQYFPLLRFDGAKDDPAVYAQLKALTAPATKSRTEARDYFPPPDSEGGWRALKGAEEIRRVAGMDAAKLDEAFEFAQRTTKNGGLLVARRGWLVYERYFGRGHREATANLASCGKGFTSVAVGILMRERGGEWRLLPPEGEQNRYGLVPARYVKSAILRPGARWQVENDLGTQPLRVRIEALPAVAAYGSTDNLTVADFTKLELKAGGNPAAKTAIQLTGQTHPQAGAGFAFPAETRRPRPARLGAGLGDAACETRSQPPSRAGALDQRRRQRRNAEHPVGADAAVIPAFLPVYQLQRLAIL